jgi:diguanylate cyclase (GGDEF)-like protein
MPEPLTGLPTHRDLLVDLPRAGTLALWVDIDGLIWLNDQFGFVSGNSAIVSVAGAIQLALKPYDAQLFRVAGDEFLTLLPGADQESAISMAERVMAAVGALAIPYRRLDKPVLKTLHVNVAVLTVDPDILTRSVGVHGLGDPIHALAADAIYQEKLRGDLPAGIVVAV